MRRPSWLRRPAGAPAPVPPHAHPDLFERVAELEAEIQEQRRLNLRVAELTDLVVELIGASARGDKAEFERLLAKYSDAV